MMEVVMFMMELMAMAKPMLSMEAFPPELPGAPCFGTKSNREIKLSARRGLVYIAQKNTERDDPYFLAIFLY